MTQTEITQEERISIFHAYHRAKFSFQNGRADYIGLEIAGYDPRYGILGFDSKNILCPYKFYNPSYCTIFLHQLSSITDEHADKLMELYGYEGGMSGAIISIDLKHSKLRVQFELTMYSIGITIEVIDYLRSKSYNIGYGRFSAQDLIDLNIVKYI